MKTILFTVLLILSFNGYSQECSERYEKGVDLTANNYSSMQ